MIYLLFYFVLTILVIAWASWKLEREGFLLADRQVPPWAAAISLAVSKFGGGLILAYGSLVYLFGFNALWFYIGFSLGFLFFASFAVRLKEQADQYSFYTMTDFYKKNSGDRAVWPIGLLCVCTMLGFTCINIVGGAKILNQISDIPYLFSVCFVSGFIGFYLLLGGFKSVIATDVLQGIIIISFLMFMFFAELPSELNFSLKEFSIGLGNIEILYIFLFGFFLPFGMPEIWPRIYAVKEKRDVIPTLLITVFVYIGLGILLSLIILGIRDNFPNMPPPQAILSGFQSILPPALSGLMAIFLFAAVMSSADTYLFQTNAALEQDLKWLDILLPKVRSIRFKMRVTIIIALVIAMLVAFFIPDVVKVVLLFTSGGFILGIFGFISRFCILPVSFLVAGMIGGISFIILSAIFTGLSFYVPLCAGLGTLGGIFIMLFVRGPLLLRKILFAA